MDGAIDLTLSDDSILSDHSESYKVFHLKPKKIIIESLDVIDLESDFWQLPYLRMEKSMKVVEALDLFLKFKPGDSCLQ